MRKQVYTIKVSIMNIKFFNTFLLLYVNLIFFYCEFLLLDYCLNLMLVYQFIKKNFLEMLKPSILKFWSTSFYILLPCKAYVF